MTRSIVGNYRAMRLNEVAAWQGHDITGLLFQIANAADQLHMYGASRYARSSMNDMKSSDDFKRKDGAFESSLRASSQILHHALGRLEHLNRYDRDVEHSVIDDISHAIDRLHKDSQSEPAQADMRVYSRAELRNLLYMAKSRYYSGVVPMAHTKTHIRGFTSKDYDSDSRDGIQEIFIAAEEAVDAGDTSDNLVYALKQMADGQYGTTGYNFSTKKFEGPYQRESVQISEGPMIGMARGIADMVIRGFMEQLGPMPLDVEKDVRQFLMGEVTAMTQKASDYLKDKGLTVEQMVNNMKAITEGKSLMGKNLVNFLTIICMDSWYALQRKFSGNPDVFDVHQAESENPDFEVFKMTPGSDKRDAAYEYIMAAASQLTKALNSAFGKEVFEQRVSRTSGVLQVLVAFSAGKGGVFQCKAEMGEGNNTTIVLTMPNREELIRAFSAMTDTPHPKDEMLPADDFEAPDVAGRAVPKPAGEDSALPGETGDLSADPGGPQLDPMSSPQEDPTRIPRMESTMLSTWRVTWMVGGKQNFMNVSDPSVQTAEQAVQWVKLRNPQARGGNPVAAQVAGVQENADPMPDVDHDPVYNNINSNLGRVIYREIMENPDVTIGELRSVLSQHYSSSLIPAAVRDVARVVGVYNEQADGNQLIKQIAHKILGRAEQVTGVQENVMRSLRRAGERMWYDKNLGRSPTQFAEKLKSMDSSALYGLVMNGRAQAFPYKPGTPADLQQRMAEREWARREKLRMYGIRPVKEDAAGPMTTGDAGENIGHQPTDGGSRRFMRRWKDAGKGFGWGNPFGDETGGNDDEYT